MPCSDSYVSAASAAAAAAKNEMTHDKGETPTPGASASNLRMIREKTHLGKPQKMSAILNSSSLRQDAAYDGRWGVGGGGWMGNERELLSRARAPYVVAQGVRSRFAGCRRVSGSQVTCGDPIKRAVSEEGNSHVAFPVKTRSRN